MVVPKEAATDLVKEEKTKEKKECIEVVSVEVSEVEEASPEMTNM